MTRIQFATIAGIGLTVVFFLFVIATKGPPAVDVPAARGSYGMQDCTYQPYYKDAVPPIQSILNTPNEVPQ